MRLLVVEDDEKMASLLKRGLEGEGYAVDVAANGEDALWAGRELPYDALVLDARRPG
jgi:two-component system, OmpR family, response regulator